MINQGVKINSWGKNVYVKVPVVNSKNKFTGRVIKKLNNQNIKLNITAVYTAKQTREILKFQLIKKPRSSSRNKRKYQIGYFAGRAGDTGKSNRLSHNYNPAIDYWKKIENFGKSFKN